jgi:hypothetical protein
MQLMRELQARKLEMAFPNLGAALDSWMNPANVARLSV